MKILLVHNAYQHPGGEDIVFEQEREMLERAGHKVVVYQRSNNEIHNYTVAQQLALVPNTIWATYTRKEFLILLDKAKPDVVHVHNTFMVMSPSIYSACDQYCVPVVQTLHNYRLFCPGATFFRQGQVCEECVTHSLWRGVQHGCYRGSRAATAVTALMLAVHRFRGTWSREVTSYIALTEFSRRKFVEAGLPPEMIFVKPNFVDPDPGFGDGGGDYAVFVGRLSPEKRISTMLDAWSRLKHRITLIIVGEGPQHKKLEAEIGRRRLNSVRFLGQLAREETLEVIRRSRFLVFSSEWYENFPVTIAESFACGIPVICSRLGSMQEIVEDGRTGLHFTAGDPEDLAQKIEWAWAHPERLLKMGNEARKTYENNYTAEKNYPILINIYEHAIQAKRALKSPLEPSYEASRPSSVNVPV